MSGCGNCCGSCGSCGDLILSKREVQFLQLLAQIPFLPAVRKKDSMDPVYPEDPSNEVTLALQCLEKRGLIQLDYDHPLKGFDYSAIPHFPIQGSIALTARGQQVIDSMEIQGLLEE